MRLQHFLKLRLREVGLSKLNNLAPPLWLLAEVTYRCPLHCVFCYNPIDYANESNELSKEEWLEAMSIVSLSLQSIQAMQIEKEAKEFKDKFENDETNENDINNFLSRSSRALMQTQKSYAETKTAFKELLKENAEV